MAPNPDVPRVMSTQHPDNATSPFFSEGDVLEDEDEIQEAYYVYSHLGCDEQMWDFEGKEGDEYAVKKLLSRYEQFFSETRIGGDVRLTVRGPNPDVEESEAKILLEILESIPRSYDAAETFYSEKGTDEQSHGTAPIFEVIIPMTTSADQINTVRSYYEKFVVGKEERTVWDDKTLRDWVGEFRPREIDVIPLIEDRQHMLDAHEILREYAADKDIESQRVFLARSDPALNYGSLSAVLINKVALQRLYDTADEIDVEVHPILGVGSAPFRGNLKPTNTETVTEVYPEVRTFTVQSAFKYDYPVEDVRDGIESLRSTQVERSERFDEDRALDIVDRVADEYSSQVERIAPVVNRMAKYVPDRRSRKLHVGLFGYSREVGEESLPRAISYTASLYSIGFPPETMGLSALEADDLDFIETVYPTFYDDLRDAVRFYNPRSLEVVPIDDGKVEKALDLVDVVRDRHHEEATTEVIEALGREDTEAVRSGVQRAAWQRKFLG
ncbi:MAG: phosphoenolpyruvate carboxylase [Halobacteria archaeon]|nr:phosphoenolpyruvate carboxylase [Halobacteria archaeon]